MQEYKANYSDFYDDSDPQGRPYGAAKDTTTPNTIDGTPIKASMINDLLGMLHASFVGASENNVPVLSGVPDKVGQSQFWEALSGYVNRRDTRHGMCATGGDVTVKVIEMANGIPALYERFFVMFDEDNTADDVQMQLGEQTLPVYTGRFAAGGVDSFYAGIPYEFMLSVGKIYSLNASHKEIEPPGIIKMFAGDKCPIGWLFCFGQELSRTKYAALFAAIGTIYGEGDGVTTFKIPDAREVAIVGAGESARTEIVDHDVYSLGEFKDDQIQTHGHDVKFESIGAGGGLGAFLDGDGRDSYKTHDIYARHGTVTRGKRLAMNYIIKY